MLTWKETRNQVHTKEQSLCEGPIWAGQVLIIHYDV